MKSVGKIISLHLHNFRNYLNKRLAANALGITDYITGQENELDDPFGWSQKTNLDPTRICYSELCLLQSRGNKFPPLPSHMHLKC